MERIYPYLTHNLVRPDMAPIVVPDEAFDRALDAEWFNRYGVDRGGSAPTEPVEKRKPGRPKGVR